MSRLTKEQAAGLFALAGIPVLRVKALPDGYGYPTDDPRYYEMPPRQVWWFVKTPLGWIEIGWRKRVIVIDWTDTGLQVKVTNDAVTQSLSSVDAWSEVDALRYLKEFWLVAAAAAPSQDPPT